MFYLSGKMLLLYCPVNANASCKCWPSHCTYKHLCEMKTKTDNGLQLQCEYAVDALCLLDS